MSKRARPTFSAENIAACPSCKGKFTLELISGHVRKCKPIEIAETEEPEPKRTRVAHKSEEDQETKESPAEVQQQSQTAKEPAGFGDGAQDYLFASNGKGKKHSKPNLVLQGIIDAHIRLHLKPEKNFKKTFMKLSVQAQNDCINGILNQIRLAFPHGLVHAKVLQSYNGRARNLRNKQNGKVWPSREKAKHEREAKRSEKGSKKDKDEGKEKDEKEKERDTDSDFEMEREDAQADKENRSPAASAPVPARAATPKARTQSQAAVEAAVENEPPAVLHMGMPVSLMAPFKLPGKSKGTKLQRIANGTILCFKATDQDLNGNVLGDGVVLVTVNGKPLTAGVGLDIGHLIPPTEAEAEDEKDKSQVFIEELETTRWKLSLIRARADSVAKAAAAAAAVVPKAAVADGHSRVHGGAGSSSNSHGLGLGGFSASASDSGND